jgi:carboxypeptidase Q
MSPCSTIGSLWLALLVPGTGALAKDDQAAQPKPEVPPALNVSGYQSAADKLIRAATESDFAFRRLAELCDRFGPRFSGTTNLEAAIDWALAEVKADGLENVHSEDVLVPHWVRGEESAEILKPRYQKLPMSGLGGSVATPKKGITAPVLVVRSFEELSQRADEARGRIVLFNAPFVNYSQTVTYRTRGASQAAKAGAVASLVRSITPFGLQTPHTGAMTYEAGLPRIPHAAITLEAADQMQRWQERGEPVVVRLKMSAKLLPDAHSRNVVAEIVGRERPEEIVLVSGHLDSWDISPGAIDDGGGVLSAWEAVRLMHTLGLRPRRTVRVVLWTNEENGLRGARNYAERHQQELPNHILAIESDRGAFQPTGFTFKGSEQSKAIIGQVGALLGALQADKITPGGGGADVEQLAPAGVPVMELTVEDSKYFWFHHTSSDTPDKVNPKELSQCAAAMAVMAYVVAEQPERLPR